MSTCRWTEQVQAYFDDEPQLAAGVKAHLEQCTECASFLRALEGLRSATLAVPRPRGIDDAQFGAFMAGIREGIESPAPRFSLRGFWAGLSLVGAATVVVLATYSIISEPTVIKATEVKSPSTQIEGATVDINSIDGVTTISLRAPKQRAADDSNAGPRRTAYEEDIQ
jgi:hypothetical protein